MPSRKTRKNTNAIFLGTRRGESGRLVQMWGNPVLSRKGFLKASAFAATAGTIGCGGGDSTGPSDNPEQDPDPVARIQGPTNLQLTSLGQPRLAEYDSSGSTPSSVYRSWKVEKVQDALEEGEIDLGNERRASIELVRPGDYTVQLRVVVSGKESTATHTTKVLPAPLPTEDYPLIAFLRREDNPLGLGYRVLHVINPSTGEVTRIGGSTTTGFFPLTASWEAGGGRLALEKRSGTQSIVVYDFMKDELVEVSTPGVDGARTVAWNPQKDWIAYSERGRAGFSEPVLTRPDGSEQLYISGAAPMPEVQGYFLSWSPDGERLVAGWTPYDITDSFFEDWRNTVYSGFWDGNLTSTRIPTEDQLMAFLDALGQNTPANRETINPCANGLAWSPDGDWMVYVLQFEMGGEGSKEYLVKSRSDGTGDLQILVIAETAPGPDIHWIRRPFWSPDGKSVYFTEGYPQEIMKVSASGGGTPSTVTSGHNDFGLGWYG